MAIDYFLYVAFVAGVVAGRFVHYRGRALTWATIATVLVLLFFLGASLSPTVGITTLGTIALAVGYAALILGLTIGILRLLPKVPASSSAPGPEGKTPSAWVGLGFLGAVVVGGVVGRYVLFPTEAALTDALYVLLFLVAFGLVLTWHGLSKVWIPLTATIGAAVIAGTVLTIVAGVPASAAYATSLAFGWYSLAGPLVGASWGATLGLLAFLTNFLRENLTMLTAPALGRRVRAEGLTAMGGAASMDTVLYFITRYGDREAGPFAIATGLILTIAASVLLPIVLGPT